MPVITNKILAYFSELIFKVKAVTVKKYLFCLVMVASITILGACKKDDKSGCDSSAKRVSAAAQQYAASPTPQTVHI